MTVEKFIWERKTHLRWRISYLNDLGVSEWDGAAIAIVSREGNLYKINFVKVRTTGAANLAWILENIVIQYPHCFVKRALFKVNNIGLDFRTNGMWVTNFLEIVPSYLCGHEDHIYGRCKILFYNLHWRFFEDDVFVCVEVQKRMFW